MSDYAIYCWSLALAAFAGGVMGASLALILTDHGQAGARLLAPFSILVLYLYWRVWRERKAGRFPR